MKRILFALVALTFTIAAVAQPPKKKKLTPEEEQKIWMEYATPGEMHQWMAKMDGTWDGDMTMWMSADAPPIKTKGVATYKMVLNGLYQEGVHTGDMMGMPFEGRSMMAYDKVKKKFISTWIDNMGSGVMTLEGTYNPKTKTLTSRGKMVDPATGRDLAVREVVTFIDEDTQKMQMYCTKDGKEMKTMEMIAKRRK